jgi:plasmid stability protein
MATLTIRNLEPELVERLKALSREHGRSMEAEVRLLLAERVDAGPSAGRAGADRAGRAQGRWSTVRPSGATWVERVRSQLAAVDALAGDDDLEAHVVRLRQEGVDGAHRVPDLGAGS